MKRIKKLFSFLTIICCLAGSIAPVYAAGQDGVIPRAVFTNEPKTSPDLYVKKTVQSAVGGYSAPAQDRFQFVLKLNGQIAKDVAYHVIDPVYGEIVRCTDNGLWPTVIPFKTDKSGVFTLKAGQTAWFEYIGTGTSYEVLELDTYLSPVTDETGAIEPSGFAYCNYVEALWGSYLQRVEQEPVYETKDLAAGGYECKAPAGGTSGVHTMLAGGCSETFLNRYTPKTDGATTTLEVTKEIAFAEGYTAPETPDFTFVVTLDGKVYANEVFTIKDKEGQVIGEAQTGKDGYFTLKGGQSAVFAEIPADVDYRVAEVNVPDDWWPIGESERFGATQAPLTSVTFHNANTSFAVKKTMEDYSKPNVDFTFRLTDALNNAMTDKTFYRYYTNGQPIYQTNTETGEPVLDENGQKRIVTDTTDTKGEFTLKPGQTVVFTGIKPGTSYRVREIGNTGYIQTLPLPTDDDLHTVSDKGNVAVLEFVNKKSDNKGTLSVTKLVQTGGEGTLTQDTFHFILYQRLKTEAEVQSVFETETGIIEKAAEQAKALFTGQSAEISEKIKDALASGKLVAVKAAAVVADEYYYSQDGESYELYIPMRSTVYSVPEGLSNPTYFTGPNNGLTIGEFTLQADQTANFNSLSADREYLVRELGLTEEYTELKDGGDYVEIAYRVASDTSGSPEGTSKAVMAQRLTLDKEGAIFTFNNQYTPKKIDLCLTKTDDRGAKLEGAEFMLYLDRGETPVLPDKLGEGETAETFRYTTNKEGTVSIKDLKAGTYWLYERKAPSGYCLLKEPIKIEITRTAEGLTVLVDGKNPEQIKDGGSKVVSALTVTPSTEEGKNDTIGLTVKNLYLYELPNSGGAGIYWYTISGVLLMLAAVLILYKNKFAGGGLRD